MGSPSPAIFARPRSHASLAIAAALLLLLYPFYHFYSVRSPSSLLSPAQLSRFNAALAQCELHEREPYWATPRSTPKNRVNPRYKASSTSSSIVILQNATVFDGEAWLGQVDVVITAGTISEIDEEASGRFRSSRTDVEIIDLEGKIVTPGLVDMHSHAGVDPLPNLRGSSDFNQVSSPLTPYARTIDAIHPDDLAIPMIAAGGVTTSLVLPGSANIIGGEAFAIKNVVPDDQLVESMLVEPWDVGNRTRWMKMACGENPKGVYPKQTNTRMGLSWALRQHLARAKEVMARQQGWCERARSADERVRFGAAREVGEAERLAEELEFELTVAMLRGQVRVNTHCYETVDLETMLRHTHEFGFRIAAFHHALSAWKVTGLLKDQGYDIPQAIFAELSFYKKEAYQANLYAGKILHDAGIPVVYKSDHPVTNAQHLLQQPQVAYTFGLPEAAALSSVTSTPAKALGLDDRIGYVREGYDADLVIWDAHPLSVGAAPLQVYIDGAALFNTNFSAAAVADISTTPPPVRPSAEETITLRAAFKRLQASGEVFAIHNITRSLIPWLPLPKSTQPYTLLLFSSQILCFSPACPVDTVAHSLTLSSGTLTPPITALSHGLGLSEIDAESSTTDGFSPAPPSHPPKAHYGLHLSSRLLETAYEAGVTRIITPPLPGGGLVLGISAGFYSGASSALDATWADEVALHVVIGDAAKLPPGKQEARVSGQLELLQELIENGGGSWEQVRNGNLTLVAHADNRDDIAQLILLRRRLLPPPARFAVFGAAEAWALANELAAEEVAVILAPWRCWPVGWEQRRCKYVTPEEESAVKVLLRAGVRVALAPAEDDVMRGMAAEAAWAGKTAGLGEEEAWRLVAGNVERIFGFRSNELLLWEGNPLSGAAVVVGVVDGIA